MLSCDLNGQLYHLTNIMLHAIIDTIRNLDDYMFELCSGMSASTKLSGAVSI